MLIDINKLYENKEEIFNVLINNAEVTLKTIYGDYNKEIIDSITSISDLKYKVVFRHNMRVISAEIILENVNNNKINSVLKIKDTNEKTIEGNFKTNIDVIKFIEENFITNIVQLDPNEKDINIIQILEDKLEYKISFKENGCLYNIKFDAKNPDNIYVKSESFQQLDLD